jgi:hypothetical protein
VRRSRGCRGGILAISDDNVHQDVREGVSLSDKMFRADLTEVSGLHTPLLAIRIDREPKCGRSESLGHHQQNWPDSENADEDHEQIRRNRDLDFRGRQAYLDEGSGLLPGRLLSRPGEKRGDRDEDEVRKFDHAGLAQPGFTLRQRQIIAKLGA